ncbi:MAG: hypothetical protein ACRC9I_10755, partial [Acinetobacter sp.]
MYGGVRGRKTKVGRKLLLFSSYSIKAFQLNLNWNRITVKRDQRKKLRDLGYAYNLHTLNKKKALSFTPLNTLLKA